MFTKQRQINNNNNSQIKEKNPELPLIKITKMTSNIQYQVNLDFIPYANNL